MKMEKNVRYKHTKLIAFHIYYLYLLEILVFYFQLFDLFWLRGDGLEVVANCLPVVNVCV